MDILTRPVPELSEAERAEVKRVARDLLDRLKQLRVLNWRQKSTARSQRQLPIQDVLDAGLPRASDKPLYEQSVPPSSNRFLRVIPSGMQECTLWHPESWC